MGVEAAGVTEAVAGGAGRLAAAGAAETAGTAVAKWAPAGGREPPDRTVPRNRGTRSCTR